MPIILNTDGAPTPERPDLVEAHLAVCPPCAQIEATLDRVEQTRRGAPAAQVTYRSVPARRGWRGSAQHTGGSASHSSMSRHWPPSPWGSS